MPNSVRFYLSLFMYLHKYLCTNYVSLRGERKRGGPEDKRKDNIIFEQSLDSYSVSTIINK